MEYNEIMSLLREGKKLKVDRNYIYHQIPTVCITLNDGTEIRVKLPSVAKEEFGEGEIRSSDKNKLRSVRVYGYGTSSGNCSHVEYIYANSPMNVLTAHLEDGRDMPYSMNSLSVLDLSCVKGEYINPIPQPKIDVNKMTVQQLADAGYEITVKKKEATL